MTTASVCFWTSQSSVVDRQLTTSLTVNNDEHTPPHAMLGLETFIRFSGPRRSDASFEALRAFRQHAGFISAVYESAHIPDAGLSRPHRRE